MGVEEGIGRGLDSLDWSKMRQAATCVGQHTLDSLWQVDLEEEEEEFFTGTVVRLSGMVRSCYLSYLGKVLAKNCELCRGSEYVFTSRDIEKCTAQMELRALRACMVSSLYQKVMSQMTADVKQDTKELKLCKKLQELIHQKCTCTTKENKETQTDSVNVKIETNVVNGFQEPQVQTQELNDVLVSKTPSPGRVECVPEVSPIPVYVSGVPAASISCSYLDNVDSINDIQENFFSNDSSSIWFGNDPSRLFGNRKLSRLRNHKKNGLPKTLYTQQNGVESNGICITQQTKLCKQNGGLNMQCDSRSFIDKLEAPKSTSTENNIDIGNVTVHNSMRIGDNIGVRKLDILMNKGIDTNCTKGDLEVAEGTRPEDNIGIEKLNVLNRTKPVDNVVLRKLEVSKSTRTEDNHSIRRLEIPKRGRSECNIVDGSFEIPDIIKIEEDLGIRGLGVSKSTRTEDNHGIRRLEVSKRTRPEDYTDVGDFAVPIAVRTESDLGIRRLEDPKRTVPEGCTNVGDFAVPIAVRTEGDLVIRRLEDTKRTALEYNIDIGNLEISKAMGTEDNIGVRRLEVPKRMRSEDNIGVGQDVIKRLKLPSMEELPYENEVESSEPDDSGRQHLLRILESEGEEEEEDKDVLSSTSAQTKCSKPDTGMISGSKSYQESDFKDCVPGFGLASGTDMENSEPNIWTIQKYIQQRMLHDKISKMCCIPEKKMAMKAKFLDLFGYDSDEDEIWCSRQQITKYRRRIASWVVDRLLPYYRERRVISRPTFKAVARQITNKLISDNHFPDESDVEKGVTLFFSYHGVIVSESDIWEGWGNFK